jgi:hypothetical protein
MDKATKQVNKPHHEFTKFIINKLRDSKVPISASNLCMAVKDNLPSQFHPNKGEFNRWMKTLYNIETDNSNPNMPFYKFKINEFEIFDKYKISDNSFIKVLLDKIKNDHIQWSKINQLYQTVQHNQSTWDTLNTIFISSVENVKNFDEKFPDFSKTIDRYRINRMPSKPSESPQNIRGQKKVGNQENTQKVQPKELNFKASLGLEQSSFRPPPGLLQPNQMSTNQETPQAPPTMFRPPPGLPPPVHQQQSQYVLFRPPPPQVHQQYQVPQAPQISLTQSLPPPPPPPSYNTVQNKPLTLDGGFESLLGLNFFQNNNLNEIIKKLSHNELLFLDKVHSTLKNTEDSALCKLIEEIGKVRNIVFS